MSLFRIAVIILALAFSAAVVVHLRWSNAHLAYKIQIEYGRQRDLKRRYDQKQLELASQQSIRQLIEQLEKWNFPLEGWTDTPSQPTTR